MNFFRAVFFILPILFFVSPASADQNWTSFQGNANHDGYVDVQINLNEITELWKYQTERPTPLVSSINGVYFISKGRDDWKVVSLNAETGTPIWTYILSRSSFSISPVAYADNKVYFQTAYFSPVDTYLWALNATNGEVVFKSPFESQWGDYYAPTPFLGNIYANVGYNGGVAAFNGKTGTKKWFTSLSDAHLWTPAVDNEYVYNYLWGRLYKLDRSTGEEIQEIPDPGSWGGYDLNLAPVLTASKGVVIINSGRLVHFNTNEGRVDWNLQANFSDQPASNLGEIYALSDGQLVVVSESNGEILWKLNGPEAILSNIVLTQSYVIIADQNKTYLVNRKSHKIDYTINKSGELMVSGNKLFIESDSEVTAYRLKK
jgi:outer membrane protein assembly factor BamB